jgi:hypothetical protein
MSQVVLASRLSDGRVVFAKRASGLSWVGLIDEATVAEDGPAAEALLAESEADIAARNEVMDAYLIDVAKTADGWRPTKYREFIRAVGPTIREDLGKQAEGAGA